jgi:hypothetical protein
MEEFGNNDRFEEELHSTISEAAKDLHESPHVTTSRSTICTVRQEGKPKDSRLFYVEFARVPDEGLQGIIEEGPGPGETHYPMGVYSTLSEEDAHIYFPCANTFTQKESSTVAGYMNFPSGGEGDTENKKRTEAALTILNSVARAVADELGCLQGANLPEELPRPSATWSPGG